MVDFFGCVALIIYLISLFIKATKELKNKCNQLKNAGFKIDHELNGSYAMKYHDYAHKIVFDDTAREIAFMSLSEETVKFSYDEITHFEWHWVERGAKKLSNELHFIVRNKFKPLIKVGGLTKKEAELWRAKLSAIIS